jgi:diguanylate cyclase (GGDEF)-like protein/PAS domain S-box-containing protein
MPTDILHLPPSELLEYLRRQVDRMAELERKVATLEREREQFDEIKEGWDWFFTNSLDMLVVHDFDGQMLRVNPAVEQVLGFTPEEFMRLTLEEIVPPEEMDRARGHLQRIVTGNDGLNFELRMRHKNGECRWLAWTAPAPTKDGRTMKHVYAIARDITESRLTQDELMYRAQHDALTGLSNRAAFDQALELALARAERLDGPVSLLLIDLDGFKQVNDTLGHLAGDEVLRTVAARLSTASRKGDVVARLGGDEFACLTLGNTDAALEAMAARILDLILESIPVDGGHAHVGCSIGIATAQGDGSPARLFDDADRAMYDVKRRGKCGFALAERLLGAA